MAHDSRTIGEYRYRRTALISALVVIGICLFSAVVFLSFCVPLAIEDDGGLIEGLYHLR